LVKVLGRGGMGTVFEARRGQGGEHFALKVLESGGDRRRFQREVEILHQLQHPNLVRVHDCGRRGDWDWYAMDFVEGRDLASLLREHRLSPQDAMQVFEDLCRGVSHAHERQVVHRDLKPQNVLVGEDLRVTVIDFGLAKAHDSDDGQGRLVNSLGTPHYMSPEQVRDSSKVDARTDVWALGVILYLIWAGKLPFTGRTTGQVSARVLNESPTPIAQLNPLVPAGVATICQHALGKDAQARYADAGALFRDVARFRAGKPLVGQPQPGALRRWWASHGEGVRVGVWVGSAVWALVVAVVLGLRWAR
jgi:serine/threonine-protein kinase